MGQCLPSTIDAHVPLGLLEDEHDLESEQAQERGRARGNPGAGDSSAAQSSYISRESLASASGSVNRSLRESEGGGVAGSHPPAGAAASATDCRVNSENEEIEPFIALTPEEPQHELRHSAEHAAWPRNHKQAGIAHTKDMTKSSAESKSAKEVTTVAGTSVGTAANQLGFESGSRMPPPPPPLVACASVVYDLTDGKDEELCPTCLEEYTMENPQILSSCGHAYHLACIYEWLERSPYCPICAARMDFEELQGLAEFWAE
ncbi:E3 ubiquitin-protein ligase [Porphyridium purpureum]|uniref:RING-type E3 ubiquitin transferase n=1 Tax=Porphyridium purpureum TaxID=35688 RepID=A0A5J4YUS6_PORPP|nr:E3 ubiquitin-protein ligase [Porphyridium purpureum]|eukprot:POR0075..scf227_4